MTKDELILELVKAYTDVVDGATVNDIKNETGASTEKAVMLVNLNNQLMKADSNDGFTIDAILKVMEVSE